MPLRKREPVRPGAVAVERVAGALADPLVARQAEVVVRAEHHDLAALDLHERPGLGLDQAEVREEVVLPRRLQLLHAVMARGLREDVDGSAGGLGHAVNLSRAGLECRSDTVRAVALAVRTVSGRKDMNAFIDVPFRLRRGRSAVGPAPSLRAPGLPRPQEEPMVRARGGRVLPVPSATASRSGGSRRTSISRWDEYQGGSDGMFGFFEVANDPEAANALARRGYRLGPRARPRAHPRADGLHDERRVRDPDRGLRRALDDPRAVAPAVLPRADGRRTGWRSGSTSSCGSSGSATSSRAISSRR